MIQKGKNGFIFDPSKPEDLEKIMLDVADHPEKYHDLSCGALNTVTLYKEDIMLPKYEEFFSRVMKQAQRSKI